MPYTSKLPREDRDNLKSEILRIADSLGEDVGNAQVAHALISSLRSDEEQGDTNAMRILSELAADGAFSLVGQVLKGADTTTFKLPSGQTLVVAARRGVRAVNKNGQRLRYYQQPLWWEMSWTRFSEMVSSLVMQRDHLGKVIVAFNDVMELRDRFPGTKTPLEACELAGIDPHEFERGDTRAA